MAHRFAIITMYPTRIAFHAVEDMPIGDPESIHSGGDPVGGKDYNVELSNTVNRLIKDYGVNEFQFIRG
ncbi:MAG: hypothetical protein MIO92_05935 [Methanosarcinaceae archaeon]|nr:hypothetical protein [Methanosarcinaceae archaeon]